MKNQKNKFSIRFALVLCTVIISFYSCKKNGVAPASSGSKISFGVQGVSTASLAATAPAATTTPLIVWTHGIANIAEFKFEAKKGGVETEIRANGLTNIDLFAANPAFANTTIDTGTYSKIEVKLEFVKSSTAAIPLTVKGNFTSGTGVTVPVEIDVNENLEVKVEAKNVFIDNTTDLKTIVTLHLNDLLAGISVTDLDAATKTGGVIIISSTSNAAIFNKVKLNVTHSGETEFEGEHEHNGGNHNGDGQGHN